MLSVGSRGHALQPQFVEMSGDTTKYTNTWLHTNPVYLNIYG